MSDPLPSEGANFLTDRAVEEMRRIIKKVDGFKGPGVVNKPAYLIFAPPSQQPVDQAPSALVANLYGYLATPWVPGSATVTLTPCNLASVPSGAANLTVRIYNDWTGTGIAPPCFAGQAGDVLRYDAVDATNGKYALVNPPIIGAGSAQYQVFQMLTSSGAGWGNIRAS
jgi:hypothetical protein